jgi:thiamine biosynthesis lipoprotein
MSDRIASSRRVLVPLDLPPALRLRPAGLGVTSLHDVTMGTTWSVKFAAPASLPLDILRSAIERVLDRVIAEMSTWIPDSEISVFNRAAPSTWCTIGMGFREVLWHALDTAADTGGAYDPTIGALVDLWGFGPPGPRQSAPDEASIASAREGTGFRRIRLDKQGRILQPGGTRLDLSSIAKGYAVDQVALTLERLGFADHLVEIGGELRGSGTKPDGSPWWVALDGPAAHETVVALHGLSVATSGDAHRYFEWNGRCWSHTIDPRTGCPVPDRLAAVTVLHRRCMCADALATALTVLGPEAGFDHARARNLAARFLIRQDGEIAERVTPAFAAMLN